MRGNNECCTLYVDIMQILIQNKTMYIYVCMYAIYTKMARGADKEEEQKRRQRKSREAEERPRRSRHVLMSTTRLSITWGILKYP